MLPRLIRLHHRKSLRITQVSGASDALTPSDAVNSSTGAARKPRGKPFEPGNRHGQGRPPGSRNKSTQLFHDLLDEFTPLLAKKTLKMALEGDRTALKLAVERVVPPAQGSRVLLRIPPVRNVSDLAKASALVIQAATRGDITIEEAKALAEMLQAHRRILEGDDHERRLKLLERTKQTNEFRFFLNTLYFALINLHDLKITPAYARDFRTTRGECWTSRSRERVPLN